MFDLTSIIAVLPVMVALVIGVECARLGCTKVLQYRRALKLKGQPPLA